MQDNDTLVRLHKEMLDQKAKLERATRELKLARQTARKKVATENTCAFFVGFERQLRVRELEAANAAAMHQLAEMVDDIAGMATTVQEQLYERGLSIPERSARMSGGSRADRGSECSSSSGSVRSVPGGGGSCMDGASMPFSRSGNSSQTGEIITGDAEICI